MKKVIYCLLSVFIGLILAVGAFGCAPTTTTEEPAGGTQEPAAGTQAQEPAYPIVTAKTRFKIATTTSLYDTGLWAYLEPMFEKYENVELDIVYAGTGAAINQGKSGNVDAVIVHDPDQEKPFVDEGWGINKRSFAYNFFLIAGPADDPAGISGLEPAAAFKKIAEAGVKDPDKVKFVSRGDNSGTHGAEKRLWADAGYVYTDIEESGKWYIEAGQGMGPTLVMANEQNAYVLCDGSTFQSYQGKLVLVALVRKAAEPTLNIYNVYAVNPDKVKTAKIKIANDFINWLISPDVQKLIGLYGVKEFGGPLFNPISDGGCIYPACPNLGDNMKPVQ